MKTKKEKIVEVMMEGLSREEAENSWYVNTDGAESDPNFLMLNNLLREMKRVVRNSLVDG